MKYKKVLQQRAKTSGENPEDPAKVKDLREQLLYVDSEEELEIFQIDECVFLGQDSMKRVWSAKRTNQVLTLDNAARSQSAKVIAAISSSGSYFYTVQEKYFSGEDVLNFLKLIKREMGLRCWAVFWDNCPTHKANKVQDYLDKKDIPQVKNLPYCPKYNGIETLWALQKRVFRERITDLKVRKQEF